MDGMDENNREVENDDSEDEEEESMPNESKTEKFVRIAERRTNKVLSDLNSLGNLSNRITYKYTTEQIDQMFTVIEARLQKVKDKFYAKEKPEDVFKFK